MKVRTVKLLEREQEKISSLAVAVRGELFLQCNWTDSDGQLCFGLICLFGELDSPRVCRRP